MNAAFPSPRTPDEPMAFTRDEFWRGAMRAWGAFLVLLLTLEVVAAVIGDLTRPSGSTPFSIMLLLILLVVSLLIGGAISGLSLAIGIPIAHRIASALRHEPRVPVHLSVFALYGFGFGALVGGASYALAFASTGSTSMGPALIAAFIAGLIAGVLSAAAVTFAWWTIARDALRADRGIPRRRVTRTDPDAVVEDSL